MSGERRAVAGKLFRARRRAGRATSGGHPPGGTGASAGKAEPKSRARDGSEVELLGGEADGGGGLTDDRLLGLVEGAVRAADDDADLDHGAGLGRLLLRLADLLQYRDLAEGEVGHQLVQVLVEAPLQVVGREVVEDL